MTGNLARLHIDAPHHATASNKNSTRIVLVPPLVIGEDQLGQGLDKVEDPFESVIGN